MAWLTIIFYLLLTDAIVANLMAWRGAQTWWQQRLGGFSKHFPLARGWTSYYLILILFIGWILAHFGALATPF